MNARDAPAGADAHQVLRERVLFAGFLLLVLLGSLTVAWPELSGDDELPIKPAKEAPPKATAM